MSARHVFPHQHVLVVDGRETFLDNAALLEEIRRPDSLVIHCKSLYGIKKVNFFDEATGISQPLLGVTGAWKCAYCSAEHDRSVRCWSCGAPRGMGT